MKPDGDDGSFNVPDPDFRYRQYKKGFDHPDFLAGYQASYDESYANAFAVAYPETYASEYKGAYEIAYNSAYQVTFNQSYQDEKDNGDAAGYQAGYDESYAPARKAAYDVAYADNFKKGEERGLPVRYQEGYDKGHDIGYAKGLKEGAAVAFREGHEAGEKKGFDDNIAAERVAAYEAGKKALVEEYATNFKVAALGAKLADGNNNGKLEAGEKFTLEVKVRNYGGVAAPKGKLTVVVEDQAKSLTLPATTAVLKELPSDTEARYFNVLTGTVQGGNSLNSVKLKVTLMQEGVALQSFVLEQNIENTIKVRAFSNPVLVSRPGGNWFVNKIWLDNIGKTATPATLKMKITSRDANVMVYQKEIPLGSIGAGQTGVFDFWVAVKKVADYSKNIFDVEIKDDQGRVLFSGGYYVPVKIQ